jgi:tetratricopeptide (TPR) repeat protein
MRKDQEKPVNSLIWVEAALKEAEQRMRSSTSSDAHWFRSLNDQLAAVMADVDATEAANTQDAVMRLHLTSVQFWYAQGDAARALGLAEHAVEICSTWHKAPFARRAWNMIGLIRNSQGDRDGARDAYMTSIELAKTLGDAFAEASVLANLAITELDSGNYRDAVVASERAIALLETVTEPAPDSETARRLHAQAHQVMARALLLQGREREAADQIDFAISMFPNSGTHSIFDVQQRIMLMHTATVMACLQNDAARAKQFAMQVRHDALQLASTGSTKHGTVEMLVCEAIVAAMEGDLNSALVRLEQEIRSSRHNAQQKRDLETALTFLRDHGHFQVAKRLH